jgi:hypothetical protein
MEPNMERDPIMELVLALSKSFGRNSCSQIVDNFVEQRML